MKFNTTFLAGAVCAGLFAFSNSADATIVELDTSLGKVRINLYDETTPIPVANFLHYVTKGTYTNNFIHRTQQDDDNLADISLEMGGWTYESGDSGSAVEVDEGVIRENKLSHVHYTVSTIISDTLTNTSTSKFSFNTGDNSADFDLGVRSVFGEITADTRDVVDALARVPIFNVIQGGGNTLTPLRNYSSEDFVNGVERSADNYVIIHSATIFDAATDTAAGLSPPLNPNYIPPGGPTLPDPTPTDPTPTSPVISGSDGGNFGIFTLIMLGLAGLSRRLKLK
ncbi:MAG: peptidylprolyl isomerase [Algicola sp.]|nr:peptidylprolyl isomerase [Algicola sp.]